LLKLINCVTAVDLHLGIEINADTDSQLTAVIVEIAIMELTLECLKSLLHSWPTLAEQRDKSSSAVTDVDYVDTPISYSDFFTKYIVSNVPCLVGDWLTRSWLSTGSWYHEESGRIQWDHLSFHFGEFTPTLGQLRECYSELQ